MAIVKTDSQHYSEIAEAIRSKSGSTAQYKPQEMPDAILELETGRLESAIIVYAPTGSQITLSCGDVIRTVPEDNGVWRFDNCGLGTWTVTASKDQMTRVIPVVIQEQGQMMRYEVPVSYVLYYGVKRSLSQTSPTWTRTNSAEGMTAKASVGAAAGSSDFDNVYPWSGIRRETLGTGDVMVRIPKFWYKRYREEDMEYLIIADGDAEGYKLHPAFCHGGVERDAVYVGAYKTSENFLSESGAMVKVTAKRSDFRTAAQGKGNGWALMDLSTLSALQMLFLVEFATYNSQAAVGMGYVSFGQYDAARIRTGSTDAVPNLTGIPAGTDGKVDVVWRGMEGLWGNVLEYVDGLNCDGANQTFYVCNDPAIYADTNENYTALGFAMPEAVSYGSYITKHGLDTEGNDHIFLAAEIASGSSSTYVCDTISRTTSGSITVAKYGGRWHSSQKAGLFKIEGTSAVSGSYSNTGSRMIYIPQEVTA